MSRVHYFQRYSNPENVVTNNTLLLFSRIYQYSPAKASQLFTTIVGDPVYIGIETAQQIREKDSVPDAVILQRSFKIVIECKVDSNFDSSQLENHMKSFACEERKILLILTKTGASSKQVKDVQDLCPEVLVKNLTFDQLCGLISDLFEPFEIEMRSIVEDYLDYCNESNLYDQSQSLLRIVPCGQSIDLNRNYGIYFQPSDRGYSKHSFIGLYTQKIVRYLWAVHSVFDVTLDGKHLSKKLVSGENTDEFDDKIEGIICESKSIPGYQIGTGHRFFCGKKVIETNFMKTSRGGIMGPRFVNLRELLKDYTDAEDIAEKLKKITWE